MREKIRLYSRICRAEFRAFYKHRKIPFLIALILLIKTGCVCYPFIEINKMWEGHHPSGVVDFTTEIQTESLLGYFHFCRILPILFYFLALYCVMTMRRKGWDEAADVACGRTGRASRYGFMLLAVGGCVLLSSLLVYAVFFSAALSDLQLRTFFLGDLTRLVALYDFLPTLFFMLAGALTGFAGSRSAAATVSVVVFFVFSSAFIDCLWHMSDVTDFFYRAGNLFRFYVPSLPVDFYHLFPMGSGCFARALFWIFLVAALLCVAVRKRLLCGIAPMAAALICLAYHLSPDGMPVYGDFPSMHDASDNGVYYYRGREWTEAPADFGVESYVMELEVGRQLEAEVAVRLTEGSGERDIYRFTLFHGFCLSSVTDQAGQKMDYERDGDFITVYGGKGVEEIRFAYAGSGKSFYATEYAVYLPSFFPYYPVPGHHIIYADCNNQRDYWDYRALRTEAYYTVRVKADIPVETSLPSVETSAGADSGVRVFEGYCCGPALVGSRYLQTYTTPEGIKVVYSGMQYTASEVSAVCRARELSPQTYGSAIIASPVLAMATHTTSYSDGYYSLITMLRFDVYDRAMEWWEENDEKIRRTNIFL